MGRPLALVVYPLIRDHHVIGAVHAGVRRGLRGAARALPVLVGIRHIVAGCPHALLRSFTGGRLHRAAHHLRRDGMWLYLPRALHPLSVVGIRILSLQGPPVRARVGAPVLVVHLLLLAAILHVVHVSLVAFGWRPIHAIHMALVVLKIQRQITLMCFCRYNHALKLGKIVITWWNVHFKMNMGSAHVHRLTVYVRCSALHKPLHVLFVFVYFKTSVGKKPASSPGILQADMGEQGMGEKTSLLSWYSPGGFGRARQGDYHTGCAELGLGDHGDGLCR